MKKIVCLISFLAILAGAISVSTAKKIDTMDLTIQDGRLSADLQNVKLRHVLQKLSDTEGIWFKGDAKLLDEGITIQFQNLSIEKGIKRILGNLDYSFVFDSRGRVRGVTVVGKGKTEAVSSHTEKAANQPPSPFAEDAPSEELPEAFKIIPNAEPPGGPVDESLQDSDAFQIIENAPPPGGPVDESLQDSDAFQIIENAPPPGSEMDAEE